MAKYLDLRVDKVFKAVFAQKAHKSSLIDLLNDLLPELHVTDLTYIRGEMQGYCFDSKSSRFDLCCQLSDGKEVTVEMQMEKQDFFTDRAVYYAALPILEEINAGQKYTLSPRYLISFLNFKLDHADEGEWGNKVTSIYSLREGLTGEKLSEAMNLVFIELARFSKGSDELENDIDRWYYLFRHINELREIPSEFRNRKFERFLKAVEYESLPKGSKMEYDRIMTTERDRINQMEYARRIATEEGWAEGLKKGMEEGMEKGMEKATLAIAERMKAQGFAISAIVSLTGLTEQQISMI